MGYIENWDIYIYYRNLGLHNHWLELHPLIPISNRNEKPRDTSAKVGLFSLAKFEVVGTTCEQLLSCWELVSGYLAGGWPTPLKNMKVSWDSYSHSIWKHKKCSKPPTRSDWCSTMFYNTHQHLQPLNHIQQENHLPRLFSWEVYGEVSRIGHMPQSSRWHVSVYLFMTT